MRKFTSNTILDWTFWCHFENIKIKDFSENVLSKLVDLCVTFVSLKMKQKSVQLTFTFYSVSNVPPTLKQYVNISKNGLDPQCFAQGHLHCSVEGQCYLSGPSWFQKKKKRWRSNSELSSCWKLFSQSVHIFSLSYPVRTQAFPVSWSLSSLDCLGRTINQIHLGVSKTGIGCWTRVVFSAEENSQWTESHVCQQLVFCITYTLICICVHLNRNESINTDGMVKMSGL